ncbi:phage-related baseplate assembly protein [Dyella sp. SG562]|uniref:baseplate assembly protein n=1 Tax=Dyella sp. SG562 TaxID=2587017 RepID=UPI001421D1FC|nr:baseplate J/gp47 family protein [Dyella sp. SG562]NII74827.1 phage-related baseplate assembly protein [Dyella sp. SG562]
MTSAIQLDRLPPPDVVEPLHYETVLAKAKEQFAALWQQQQKRDASLPDIDLSRESEPVVKILQTVAYVALGLRQRVNDAARANFLATALGADLDHIGAWYGVERLTLSPAKPTLAIPAVMESDDALRERITLAPASFSVAGPEAAYVFHARSASGDVLDASAISPQPDDIRAVVADVLARHDATPALVADMQAALAAARWPGEVIVSVLSRQGNGQADPALLAAVADNVSADNVRPLTDFVTVQSADIVPFQVRATLWTYAGPDADIVRAASRASLDTYLAEAKRLDRDITLSGLYAALQVAGIQNVELEEPRTTLVIGPTQAAHCTGVELAYGGIGG